MQSKSDYAVEVRDLYKSLGGSPVIRGASFAVRPGEFFSLLGPSGCGKSTTLRLIAGFDLPDSGTVRVHGRPAAEAPAFAAEVNLVFQSYALFPHMDVWDNVAFGLRMMKVEASETRRRVEEMLELVRLAGYGKRLPRELSGGQQQRVALARALAPRPSVLLLDEPLGALDLQLRKEMQRELKALQRRLGPTFIYVTHDQEEALTMSSRIAVMHEGRILQAGTPEEIYENPRSRFVADFIGETNLLPARFLAAEERSAIVEIAGARMRARLSGNSAAGSSRWVAIRPERIEMRAGGDGDAGSALAGVVEEVVYFGTDRIFRVRLSGGLRVSVRRTNTGAPAPGPGEAVLLSWSDEAAGLLEE